MEALMRPVTLAFGAILCSRVPTALGGPCLDVGLDSYGASLEERADVIDRLLATGSVGAVGEQPTDLVGADTTYDVLFLAVRSNPDGPNESLRDVYGDALADYLDAGGAVVITQRGISDAIGPTGRFRSEYLPLSTAQHCSVAVEVETPLVFPADNPLFQDVGNLHIGRYTVTSCSGESVRSTATVHASLPNGQPLVVSDGPVVAVNVFYGSDAVEFATLNPGYPADADFPQLFANAINTAAGFDPATACNGDYDDDGLLDEDEAAAGTDFQRADTDADGILDGADNCPTLSNPDQRDWDTDGIGDACADSQPPDTDDDGHPDPYDNCPEVPNPDQSDADNNGTGDACEPEPDTEGDTDDDAEPDTDDASGNCSTTGGPAVPILALLALLTVRRRRVG